MLYYEILQLELRLRLKLEKTSRISMESITVVKIIHWIQHTKKNKKEKNKEKNGKKLYQLVNKAIYGKKMEKVRNRTDVKLVKNKKGYLKCISN